VLRLTSNEHKDAGRFTRQLLRCVREISAEVAWLFLLGAIEKVTIYHDGA
jgi:hypothetical protein